MQYLMWYDDNPKKPVEAKLREGAAAYAARFGHAPSVAIVHDGERCAVAGLEVITRAYIRPHNFWLGVEVPESEYAG